MRFYSQESLWKWAPEPLKANIYAKMDSEALESKKIHEN